MSSNVTTDPSALFLKLLSQAFILEEMEVLEIQRKEIFTDLLTNATVTYRAEVAVGFELRGINSLGDSRDPIETLAFVPVLAKGPGDYEEYKTITRELGEKNLTLEEYLRLSDSAHDEKLNALTKGHIIRLSEDSLFRKVFEKGVWEGNTYKKLSYTGERVEPFFPYTQLDMDCIKRYNGNPGSHNFGLLTIEGEPYKTKNEAGEEVLIEQMIGGLWLANLHTEKDIYLDPLITRDFRRWGGIRLARVRDKQRALEGRRLLADSFANTIEGEVARAGMFLGGANNPDSINYKALLKVIGELPEDYRGKIGRAFNAYYQNVTTGITNAKNSLGNITEVIDGLKRYAQQSNGS